MARIAGITIPNEKRVEVALTYIYGIGRKRAANILAASGIPRDKRTKDLTNEEIKKLTDIIEKQYRVEGELKRDVLSNVKRLKEIGAYRGARHAKGLPVRGQRSKTNSRTIRGNVRKTMGSGRTAAMQKT